MYLLTLKFSLFLVLNFTCTILITILSNEFILQTLCRRCYGWSVSGWNECVCYIYSIITQRREYKTSIIYFISSFSFSRYYLELATSSTDFTWLSIFPWNDWLVISVTLTRTEFESWTKIVFSIYEGTDCPIKIAIHFHYNRIQRHILSIIEIVNYFADHIYLHLSSISVH